MRWMGIVLLSMGCQSLPNADLDLDAALPVRGGCGDAFFYAKSESEHAVLAMLAPGLFTASVNTNQIFDAGWDFPSEDILLEFDLGQYVGLGTCTDVIDQEVILEHQYLPTSGRIEFHVEPSGVGSAKLIDVVLEHTENAGDPLSIPELTIDTNQLGFIPG